MTTEKRFRLPILYRKILLLCIVFGPIVWLMFTEDGQRRTDTMVLWLFGEAEIKLDFKALTSHYTEREMRQVYADLDWQCQDHSDRYGERFCVSRLGIFNGIPARYVTLYYRAGQLSALKLRYRAINHAQLRSQLRDQLGEPMSQDPASNSTAEVDRVLQWHTGQGSVLLKSELGEGEEAALFWVADGLLAR